MLFPLENKPELDFCKKWPNILPLDILFCNFAPTISADGKTLVFVINVNFNVSVLTFALPRILAVLHYFRHRFHRLSSFIVAKNSFKLLDQTTFYCGESKVKLKQKFGWLT